MAVKSREETNFNRLLHRCEAMASDKQYDDWRLEKYIGTLQEYLTKLRTMATIKPSQEMLTEYTRKVDFLKGLMEAEKLPSSTDRVLAVDLLAPASRPQIDTPSKDLHLQTKARYQRETREELMTDKGVTESGVRQRKLSGQEVIPPWRVESSGTVENQDIDTILRHQQEVQEKLAEEMVSLARNMKENATVAHRIVRDDTKKLSDSNRLAETNYGRLKVESDRLDQHVQKSCNWWLWIMLIVVCMVFVWMVVFMKLFPKS